MLPYSCICKEEIRVAAEAVILFSHLVRPLLGLYREWQLLKVAQDTEREQANLMNEKDGVGGGGGEGGTGEGEGGRGRGRGKGGGRGKGRGEEGRVGGRDRSKRELDEEGV